MAQLLVRNIEDQLKTRLKSLARKHGRSMEEEVRDILRSAVREDAPLPGLGTEIAALFRGQGLDDEIPEHRGYPALPATFEP